MTRPCFVVVTDFFGSVTEEMWYFSPFLHWKSLITINFRQFGEISPNLETLSVKLSFCLLLLRIWWEIVLISRVDAYCTLIRPTRKFPSWGESMCKQKKWSNFLIAHCFAPIGANQCANRKNVVIFSLHIDSPHLRYFQPLNRGESMCKHKLQCYAAYCTLIRPSCRLGHDTIKYTFLVNSSLDKKDYKVNHASNC